MEETGGERVGMQHLSDTYLGIVFDHPRAPRRTLLPCGGTVAAPWIQVHGNVTSATNGGMRVTCQKTSSDVHVHEFVLMNAISVPNPCLSYIVFSFFLSFFPGQPRASPKQACDPPPAAWPSPAIQC